MEIIVKWESPIRQKNDILSDNDIRIVYLPVKVLCKFSDKIILNYDEETGIPIEYKNGFLLEILPNQEFVYNNEKPEYYAQAIPTKSLKTI